MTGGELRSIRQELNLSMDEFARELGYEGGAQGNRTTIKRFETGQRPVSAPVGRLAWMLSEYGLPEWPEFVAMEDAA